MQVPSAASADGALEGCSIVYFGNEWAAENRTSSHHIARRLGARFPLLYVDTPGLRAPKVNSRDLGRLFRKLAASLRGPEQVGPHMWRMTLPQIPLRRIPGVNTVNHVVARILVRRAMRGLQFGRKISWFTVPHPGFLAGHLREQLVVYYCIDDYAAHPGVDPLTIGEADLALTRRADRLFVAPPALVPAKQKINPSAVYSPHGVDVELFGRANDKSGPLPAALAGRPRPIVGFFGSLADWIDIELLVFLARSRPAYTFVLIGQSFTDTRELPTLSNVILAGPQPYEQLPDWARAFDAAIIPYRLNQQVLNANPLKLREYLATGVPIVSVTSPEIEKFSQYVSIAKTNQEFLAAVDLAVLDKDTEARRRRVDSVHAMSWDARVAAVVAQVNEDLHQRLTSSEP